ncbi:MAG: ABC transporter ATP-binding protein [Euryarchaeota archaeon]|nr:ABC transporter ATP-binding protein [Euryarchaeota archaeon]
MNNEVVRLKDVFLNLNRIPILEGISFSIEKNDFLAVIGPNGGGKSTLLKIILGLIRPDSGEVKVFGRKPEEARNLIGYLPQHSFFDLNFPVDVFDAVLMGRYNGIFKNYSNKDNEAVENALERVGMLKFRHRQMGKLSGGQMQRVFIARAIVRNPKLLLLDEPMASIDPEMQSSFYELLSKLKEKMTIVLVTHDVGVVSAHVDKIACLNRKLFCHGPPEVAAGILEDVYKCPVELIAHGIPHRVLKEHDKK